MVIKPRSDSPAGPLSAALSALLELSPQEEAAIRDLRLEPRDIAPGEVVADLNEPPPILAIKKGWLAAERSDSHGRRRIVEVHLPGDLAGLADLALSALPYRIYALSHATIYTCGRDQLEGLLSAAPRLGCAFAFLSSELQQLQYERACAARTGSALARLALFIRQTMNRLSRDPHHSDDQFHCPMTQEEIGAFIGISNVHVSRTIKALESEGCIERRKSFIQILDGEELDRLAGLTFAPPGRDLSWLPGETARRPADLS